jgi:hypothetical protein
VGTASAISPADLINHPTVIVTRICKMADHGQSASPKRAYVLRQLATIPSCYILMIHFVSSILGIDLGSTSTRAYIRCVETAEYHHVYNPNRNNLSSRFEFGDFSSLGYPFDDGPVYLGEDHDPSRLFHMAQKESF